LRPVGVSVDTAQVVVRDVAALREIAGDHRSVAPGKARPRADVN
jgi:hypothetical protein